ncbi:hypothetical protein NP493_2549g00003, partial [Ridgeia piscesae]
FTASDGKGGVAAAEVSVNLCDCSGHGECLFDLLADGYELKQTFRIVQCNCSTGWEGDHCESDLDGCQDNPCTEGTNCTDVTPEEQVSTNKSFTCSECPQGTKENEGTCLHVEECIEGTSHCEQECTNTVGSFVCSCVDGYTLNPDNKTCSIEADLESRCKELHCSYNCKETAEDKTKVECFCKSGYKLDGDKRSCDDVDECKTKKGGCDHSCTNFDGGFNCSCNDGFQLMKDKKGCKPCPSGYWGKDCLRDCSCREMVTVCNETSGCADCPDGFKGGDCQDDINECNNNPCDEHANCTNTFDIDECCSSPCLNGGTCKNLVSKFRCSCVRGFTGTVCEAEINICESNPCKNAANCTQAEGKYFCACPPGYTGLNCDIGTAQGDSLSPVLFTVYLKAALCDLQSRLPTRPPADDKFISCIP